MKFFLRGNLFDLMSDSKIFFLRLRKLLDLNIFLVLDLMLKMKFLYFVNKLVMLNILVFFMII